MDITARKLPKSYFFRKVIRKKVWDSSMYYMGYSRIFTHFQNKGAIGKKMSISLMKQLNILHLGRIIMIF